ncbi:hypothetical protein [Alicyclobacillus fodiniaquatilis]|uniref:PRTase-CE domain-containing protein n=1 Tax=Alicyclobacillus fodiniaquatilis TaxID=1661150 RepID=A0ABW4JHK9_9BACL
MAKKNINALSLFRLRSIFEQKKWPIEDDSNEKSTFNRFCSLLSILSDDQQKFILELTEHFEVIPIDMYMPAIVSATKQVIHDLRIGKSIIKTLFFLPLIAPEDSGKIKSSTTVWYLCKSGVFNQNSFFNGFNFSFIDEIELFSNIGKIDDKLLVLVDDFVGSGDTARSAVQDVVSKGVPKDKICIMSIAGLSDGIQELRNDGILTYCDKVLHSGISSRYQANEVSNKMKMMNEIESAIHVSKKYAFGYRQSEGLVKLIRTPNNTFPIYWFEVKKHNHLSPFPRN